MKKLMMILPLLAAVVPGVLWAQGCDKDPRSAQISCTEGQVWDSRALRCVILDS